MGKEEPAVVLHRHGLGSIDLLRQEEAEPSGNECASLFHTIICQGEPQLVVQFHQSMIGDIAGGHAGIMHVVICPYFAGQPLHFFQRLRLQFRVEGILFGLLYDAGVFLLVHCLVLF